MSETVKQDALNSSVPVPVLVATIAIIATRLLGLALQMHELGLEEMINFVRRSALAWDSTLVFIAGQLILFIELRCALALLSGRNWGRWGYGLSQLVVISYLFIVSVGWSGPETFILSTDNSQQIAHLLVSQELPDLLVLLLLIVPASSREFFRQR